MTDIVLNTITKNDRRDIWLWRNHPEARKSFFNTEVVSWQEHKKWVASKIKDSHTKIYIARLDKERIGVIRFEIGNICVKVSVNLNPDFFGRGLGSRVIRAGTEKFFEETEIKKPIIAEIKRDNIASQNAFTKAGYEIRQEGKGKLIYEKNNIQAYLVGKKIYLRPISPKDINKKYLSWLNDAEVTKYMETRFRPPKLKDLEDYYKKISNSKNNEMFAIVVRAKHEYIGNIKLGSISLNHRYADLGIMIGEKKYWGKGYGQEACRLLLKYAFKVLDLNKVILGVYGNHKPAIRAYERIGFKTEGRIRKLLNFENRYVDKLIMGISSQEFFDREGYIKK